MLQKPKPDWQKLTVLSVLAGLLYNSWPLGYWLNPQVVRHGLASDLADSGQPHSWLFKYGDVISGLLVLGICWVLAQRSGQRRQPRITLAALAVFGAGAVIAALCSVGLIHSIASVAAGFSLFVSLASLRQQRASRRLTAQVIIYTGLGIWTLLTLFGPAGVLAQNIFITYCALCVAIYPWSFRYVYEPESTH